MRLTRIFVDEPLAANTAIKLGPAAAGHISRVLRLKPGDGLTLFDGRGGQYPATLLEVRGTLMTVRTGAHEAIERESPLHITLAQGVSRGERMDWVIQKATELGVAQIIPVLTERGVVKLDAPRSAKKADHWRAIAVSACEQCGRNRIPEIHQPTKLRSWLDELRDGGERLLLDPSAAASLRAFPSPERVTLLIGPEGGLTNDEQALAHEKNFRAVRVGPRILRTETAAIAALSILQTTSGDLA
jgi:16S rRNA (uracil1498-N3)-methyltransferase